MLHNHSSARHRQNLQWSFWAIVLNHLIARCGKCDRWVHVYSESMRNHLNVSWSNPLQTRKHNCTLPKALHTWTFTSAEAVNTGLGSFLSRQGHISTHNHFCSVRRELQHVCYWQVLLFADLVLNRFSCRELHLCMAILEHCLKYYTVSLKKKKRKKRQNCGEHQNE